METNIRVTRISNTLMDALNTPARATVMEVGNAPGTGLWINVTPTPTPGVITVRWMTFAMKEIPTSSTLMAVLNTGAYVIVTVLGIVQGKMQ